MEALVDFVRVASAIVFVAVGGLALLKAKELCLNAERFTDRWWLILGIGITFTGNAIWGATAAYRNYVGSEWIVTHAATIILAAGLATLVGGFLHLRTFTVHYVGEAGWLGVLMLSLAVVGLLV